MKKTVLGACALVFAFAAAPAMAADMATDRDNPLIEDMISLGEPDKLPPRPFLDIGVRARFAWEHWSNRHEA